jgi:membrane fusion protein, multidrug efflux system
MKASVLRRAPWLVLLVAGAFVLYHSRNSLERVLHPSISTMAAAANDMAPNGAGRGARGRGGRAVDGLAVVAVAARKADMPVYLRGLGNVTPDSTVTVRSRVDGQLVKVAFTEGQYVRAGDLLAEIDRRPFEVQLAQAQAQHAQARGNLDRDTAFLKGATTEYVRNNQLLERGLISKQDADIQSATVDQYEGSIQADHAAMETAQAAIANAQLQITYSKITAPISGRIGLRLIDPGNIVRAADTNGIAVIAQIQPIAVLFNIPEDNVTAVLKKTQGGQRLRVDAYDRDDQNRLATGTLLTVDNQIDQSTGTSKLKAVFDNESNTLFPNQFVNMHLLLDVERNATIIPMAAVQRGPQGIYVYVVDENRRARIRTVTLKHSEGSDVAVGSELKPGELVVVEGADKIQEGLRVDAQVESDQRTQQ